MGLPRVSSRTSNFNIDNQSDEDLSFQRIQNSGDEESPAMGIIEISRNNLSLFEFTEDQGLSATMNPE